MNSNALKEKQLTRFHELLGELTTNQQIWLSGYLEGRLSTSPVAATTIAEVPNNPLVTKAKLTILYGTETGNSHKLAKILEAKASAQNVEAKVISMADYNPRKLKEETNVAILVSTHGEGNPPDMAEDFYNFITGKRAPQLSSLRYSVLALGDKTYKYFCKTGEEIDKAFTAKGAEALTPLTKCDVDYEQTANEWMDKLLGKITPGKTTESATSQETGLTNLQSIYSRSNPFMATVLEKVKITGRDSDKEVYHIELSLEDSGIKYEPGDSLGIFTQNPEALVEKILAHTGIHPNEKVVIDKNEVTIKDALTYHLEITVINLNLLQQYQEFTQNEALKALIEDDSKLDDYLYGHDVLDLLEDFPYEWTAEKLTKILRKLPPRLYSISSSQEKVEDEVHITISVVRYERKNRERVGACTNYLVENLEIGKQVPIYIDQNPSFKLPADDAPIIMVGAGTGIAPFRAFLQEREAKGLKGKTWLFFGERRFRSDFLYQLEWQNYLKSGVLEKIDVAFSRDQEEKIYVQHKLLERQKEIFDWLEKGAYLYLCGDMKRMARDVKKALVEIIQNQAGIDSAQAGKYIKNLKKEKRFQTDVY